MHLQLDVVLGPFQCCGLVPVHPYADNGHQLWFFSRAAERFYGYWDLSSLLVWVPVHLGLDMVLGPLQCFGSGPRAPLWGLFLMRGNLFSWDPIMFLGWGA